MRSLRNVIEDRAPLEEILKRDFDINANMIHEFRTACAREVFQEILSSRISRYSFEAAEGWPGLHYLAGTCLEWIIPLSLETWQDAELLHRLDSRLHRQYRLMPGLPLVARMLRVTHESKQVLKSLSRSSTLEQFLAQFEPGSTEYRLALRLATVFEATNALTIT